ncbi:MULTISPECIES: hypothetical protein [unclassified Calothrix]|nr:MULTISPECIES: hypothetical protein [unclassified Calothrix]
MPNAQCPMPKSTISQNKRYHKQIIIITTDALRLCSLLKHPILSL